MPIPGHSALCADCKLSFPLRRPDQVRCRACQYKLDYDGKEKHDYKTFHGECQSCKAGYLAYIGGPLVCGACR